jgi:uncharacterized membrane protein
VERVTRRLSPYSSRISSPREIVDEEFWGRRGPRIRLPADGSLVVTGMGVLVAAGVVATVAGLILLWPAGHVRDNRSLGMRTLGARVEKVSSGNCGTPGPADCLHVTAKLLDGDARGSLTRFTILGQVGSLALVRGDRIRVYRNKLPAGAISASGHKPDAYAFADFDRRTPMLWLAVGFVALLLLTGRLHGLRALLGLVASLFLVIEFVIPAILDGRAPVAVAVVGAFAVMLVTMPLSYGLGAKMMAAWIGTGASLLLAAGLADGFASLSHLSGISSDESIYLGASSNLSLRGLLIAGMVIGALGVLVDLTVSQASTVIALRRTNPSLGFRGLFRGAIEVGHDHIAATVNTLVFAYAGAALPILLIFSIGGTSFTDAINSEAVAEPVVAMLVGSIGLIASMPITTALAALLAPRMSDDRAEDVHVHAH